MFYTLRKIPKLRPKFLQQSLHNLQEGGNKSGQTFSVSKTKFVIFTRKRANFSFNLYLNGTLIQEVTKAKFLDRIIDHRLTRRPHILQLKKRCILAINILNMLNNRHHGLTSSKLFIKPRFAEILTMDHLYMQPPPHVY